MKFLLLIYNDPALVDALPPQEFDADMRSCFVHADELKSEGRLLESQQLAPASTAKSVRIRQGRQTTVDGPFAETKELLGGFNLIDAADMDEAVRMAAGFPWAKTGCVEVRAVRDIDAERRRVAADATMAAR
ncbi:MAG: YciI family protein [Gemmatimonadales bacterium]